MVEQGLSRLTADQLKDILGPGNLNFLCKQYVHHHPSPVRDLGDYGQWFADFPGAWSEIRDYPLLADDARPDWLCDRAVRLFLRTGDGSLMNAPAVGNLMVRHRV